MKLKFTHIVPLLLVMLVLSGCGGGEVTVSVTPPPTVPPQSELDFQAA